jgi:2-deoxy-D-gluconate 3-dehydrogenase
MTHDFDLGGEVAFVTGGNSGIGRGIALALARAGAAVAIAARDRAKLDATRAEIEALGRPAASFTCDVAVRAEIDAAVDGTRAALGKISIVVNNAGAGRVSRPERLAEDDWDRVLDTNLKGAFMVAQACFPALVANGRGKIINVASEYALFGASANIAYGSSKGGILAMTYALADGWARHNIQVNALVPGVIETGLWEGFLDRPDARGRLVARTPAARLGQPEDIGGPAVFLASRASDFVTGQWLAVDGGFNIADPVVR